jgi:hypothetical protein
VDCQEQNVNHLTFFSLQSRKEEDLMYKSVIGVSALLFSLGCTTGVMVPVDHGRAQMIATPANQQPTRLTLNCTPLLPDSEHESPYFLVRSLHSEFDRAQTHSVLCAGGQVSGSFTCPTGDVRDDGSLSGRVTKKEVAWPQTNLELGTFYLTTADPLDITLVCGN